MATVIPIHMPEKRGSQSPLRLNRLLQLCSANLPVGGFSFSQGLEYAVEMGWINNPKSTKEWIEFNLSQSITCTDLALLNRLQKALVEDDFSSFHKWNQHALACRESNELTTSIEPMGDCSNSGKNVRVGRITLKYLSCNSAIQSSSSVSAKVLMRA